MAYVTMYIAGTVVAVLMCSHDAVEPAEVFGRKLHAQLVSFLHRQTPFGHVLGVE